MIYYLIDIFHETVESIKRSLCAFAGFRLCVSLIIAVFFIGLLLTSIILGFPKDLSSFGKTIWIVYIEAYWVERPFLLLTLFILVFGLGLTRVLEYPLFWWVPTTKPEYYDIRRDRILTYLNFNVVLVSAMLGLISLPLVHLFAPNYIRLIFFFCYSATAAATYHSLIISPKRKSYLKSLTKYTFKRPPSYNSAFQDRCYVYQFPSPRHQLDLLNLHSWIYMILNQQFLMCFFQILDLYTNMDVI